MEKDDHKPYTARRWTDIPVPRVVRHRELTPEERENADRTMERILRRNGVLNEGDTIENGKVVRSEELKKRGDYDE